MHQDQDIAIVWFRQDLRLADNPALHHAIRNHNQVLPIYIYDTSIQPNTPMGQAQRWWLHCSLLALDGSLKNRGASLIILHGDCNEQIERLLYEFQYAKLSFFWNKVYEPKIQARDMKIKKKLQDINIDVQEFNGSLLCEPQSIFNKQGNYFKVYTPFARSVLANLRAYEMYPKPRKINVPSCKFKKTIKQLHLLQDIEFWANKFSQYWTPGELGAHKQLRKFLTKNIDDYAAKRDQLGFGVTSKCSPYLHFGELSPWQVYYAVQAQYMQQNIKHNNVEKFIAQLLWREFSYYLLHQFPKLDKANFNSKYDAFSWEKNNRLFKKWKKGLTGYPIVDAGMRELWETGIMHNRVRMITASFLIKDLLIDWRKGAQWFTDTLLDADLANNAASWQWVAGSGADAAPYFRVFNPVLQGNKFDSEGIYVRRWVPELANLPNKYLHNPWEAPLDILQAANVQLGTTYPLPIVDHAFARDRVLAIYKSIAKGK